MTILLTPDLGKEKPLQLREQLQGAKVKLFNHIIPRVYKNCKG